MTYEYYSDNTPKGVFGTIFDPNGVVLEQFFPVSQPTTGLGGLAAMTTDVAHLSAGRFVTTWRDGRDDPDGDIYASLYQNDHWAPPPPLIPGVGLLGLIALLLGVGWSLKSMRKNMNGAKTLS